MLTGSIKQIRRQLGSRIELIPQALRKFTRHETTRPNRVIRAWIDALPVDRPSICSDMVISRLPSLIDKNLPENERFELLERLSEQLSPILRELESIPEQASRQSVADREANLTGERILFRLSEAYASLVLDQSKKRRRSSRSAISRPIRISALRCCQLSYRRALLACRGRHTLDSEYWSVLARLYTHARGMHFHEASLDSNSSDSIARFFSRILLLVLADTQTLNRPQIEQVRFYVERYGHLARITQPNHWTGDDEGWFLAWPTDGVLRPMLSSKEVQPEVRDRLLLDAHPILARLDSQREGLAAGSSPTRLGLPLNARDADYQLLLENIRQKWSRPPRRQAARFPLRPHATVVIGFDEVREAMKAIAQKAAGREVAQKTLGEDWEIADHSDTGFRIERSSDPSPCVDIGELVALSPLENGALYLAVTRRARCNNSHDQELGLEVLGSSGLAARFTPGATQGKPAPTSIPIIFLPCVHALGNSPGLLVPIDGVDAGVLLSVPHHGERVRFETAERVERFSRCELIRLNRVESKS